MINKIEFIKNFSFVLFGLNETIIYDIVIGINIRKYSAKRPNSSISPPITRINKFKHAKI